jgi:hypothetical protein
MRSLCLLFALVSISQLAHAQQDLYLSTFGAASGTSSFSDPDSLSTGTTQGLWAVYDENTVSGPSPTYISNLNGSPSPQGGNYWMGQMQGAGGGAGNFINLFYYGARSDAFLDSSSSPTSLVHGENYTLHLWLNPFEFVTDDGTGTNPYSTGALPFTINGLGILDSVSGSTLFSDLSYSKSVGFGGWTDLAVPFQYDSAWGTDFRVSLGFYTYGGSVTTDQLITSGTVTPGMNRVQSVGVDFGVAAVPEPSGMTLLGITGLLSILRRRRA